MYHSGKKVFEYFEHVSEDTAKDVDKNYGVRIKQCTKLINAQFLVLEHASWTFAQGQFSGRDITEPVLISALHKGVFVFYSALDLTRRGFYGPAGALLRSAYESLVIAKFVTISHSTSVFDAWIKGNQVHLTNHVFNRIKKPEIFELRYLWKSLHQTAHATIFAQQVYLEYPLIEEEIALNLSLIQILLCMNQHLLGTHFLTKQTVRYTKMYGDSEGFDVARRTASELAKEIRGEFNKSGKQVVREFSASWDVKK